MVRQNVMVKGFGNSFMNNANVKNYINHKQQLNNKTQKPMRGQNLQQFNNAVHELCSMYDAVNYFGKSDYSKKNGWRIINKHQLNTATIYAIRYAPVVPKRNATRNQRQQPKQQQKQLSRQQPKQQKQLSRQQSKQQKQLSRQQSRRQGGNIGGCKYRPNVPRVYNYNTTPLPNTLYPVPKNYNHLYDAFTYFGNPQVRNIKSWIESSRTHNLNSIASVFAKRNAPYVPVRQNRSNKKNQQQKMQRNVPKQQPNKRQNKKSKIMINQQPLSNVWEDYFVSPSSRMFK